MLPTIAIIGRANVGKSTLFNRLTGKKYAITADVAGVTRDIQTKEASLFDLQFHAIDTAGYQQDKGDKEEKMRLFMQQATERADAIIVMIDGLMPLNLDDTNLIQDLRKNKKPYIILLNKAENEGKTQDTEQELYSLGFTEIAHFSAEHAIGLGSLYDFLRPICDSFDTGESEDEKEKPIIMAIMGRPNVGKSTLINSIFAETRVLAGDEAGLTRDSTRHRLTHQETLYEIIDTAGLRKKNKVKDDLEKMSSYGSLQALKYAHIALLMIDATQGIEKQDLVLASRIIDEGRAPIILLNKWDLVEDKKSYMKNLQANINHILPRAKQIDVIPMSATKNWQIETIFERALHLYTVWNKRISTNKLNNWFQEVSKYHLPNPVKGVRPKLNYITQHKARPPSFIIFVTRKHLIQNTYLHFLENRLRQDFDLKAVPIRFTIKAKNNPFKPKG